LVRTKDVKVMDKRYQVFVSSTYADLKDERQKVLQTLMEMDCIPSGMEFFPATDQEQWLFIKKIIDDCDYYLLIIGGRYGSTADEGISYTEKEYDYAVEKGLNVIAFIHDSPEDIPRVKADLDHTLIDKLEAFKTKVKTGRLVRFWNQANELPGIVALSLSKAFKHFPAVGWIRADTTSSIKTLTELIELRKKNDELELKLQGLFATKNDERTLNEALNSADLFDLSESVKLPSTVNINGEKTLLPITVSLSEIFNLLAPEIVQPTEENRLTNYLINCLQSKVTDFHTSFFTLRETIDIPFNFLFRCRVHFIALKLMTIKTEFENGKTKHYWQLTDNGTVEMLKKMAFTHEDE
jgi:hypothetical protein